MFLAFLNPHRDRYGCLKFFSPLHTLAWIFSFVTFQFSLFWWQWPDIDFHGVASSFSSPSSESGIADEVSDVLSCLWQERFPPGWCLCRFGQDCVTHVHLLECWELVVGKENGINSVFHCLVLSKPSRTLLKYFCHCLQNFSKKYVKGNIIFLSGVKEKSAGFSFPFQTQRPISSVSWGWHPFDAVAGSRTLGTAQC